MSIGVMAAVRLGWAGAWVAFGFDVAAKAALFVILTLAIHILLGRRRLLARGALWNACLLGLLVLAVAARAVPRLGVNGPAWIGRALPIVEDEAESWDQSPADERPLKRNEPAPAYRDETDGGTRPRDAGLAGRVNRFGSGSLGTDPAFPAGLAAPRVPPHSRTLAEATAEQPGRPARRSEPSWANVVLLIYLGVAAFLLARFALALVAVRRLRCSARASSILRTSGAAGWSVGEPG